MGSVDSRPLKMGPMGCSETSVDSKLEDGAAGSSRNVGGLYILEDLADMLSETSVDSRPLKNGPICCPETSVDSIPLRFGRYIVPKRR